MQTVEHIAGDAQTASSVDNVWRCASLAVVIDQAGHTIRNVTAHAIVISKCEGI